VMAQADKMYDKAEEFMKQALLSAELADKDKTIHVRNAHNTIGNFYITRKKYQTALPHLEKALSISESTGADPTMTAIDIDNIALVYSELGDHKKAIAYSDRALASNEIAPQHQHYLRTKGIILFNQGKSYERLAQTDSAIRNYDASIKVLTTLVAQKPYESWRVDVVQEAKKSLVNKQ